VSDYLIIYKNKNHVYLIRNTLNANSPAPEPVPIPQSDSSFTVSSSGGLSTSAPLPNSSVSMIWFF
jgi:hypothetical protein